MKQFLISFVLIVAFVAYAFYYNIAAQNPNSSNSTVSTNTTNTNSNSGVVVTDTTTNGGASSNGNTVTQTHIPAQVPVKTPVQTPVPVITPVVVKKTTGQYVDGIYTGAAINEYYGTVQVAAVISGGRLTKVTFLQYPTDRSTSKAINQRATPQLAAQAIQVQSANVSGVSGASATSDAFSQSLASALSQAAA